MGPNASVRVLEDKSPVEILDLDAETTTQEVADALTRYDGGVEARVVSLRKAYGGSQTAVVLLPPAMAARLCKAGRIRVGLVYARVRHTEPRQRCLKCLNFNHMARECVGQDRTGLCWKCGEEGHRASNCGANTGKISVFREVLRVEAQMGKPAAQPQ